MAFPYEDLPGFKSRSTMPPGDVDALENSYPGFVVQSIATESSWINGRLRKRYGNSVAGCNGNTPGNSLPWGRVPPALIAAGTNPPTGLALVGTPILGSLMVGLQVTYPGAAGTAVFKYTINGGVTYTMGLIPLALSSIPLVGTGMSLQVPTGAVFSLDNVYAAATPVPEILLKWVNALVTLACYRRRGFNPQDPSGELIVQAAAETRKEVQEAADSKDGLFDLPASEDLDSAVTTGGPLGRSDASPYAWQDRQADRGSRQDSWSSRYFSGIWGP
jgi:hypothetical protein